VPSPLPRSNRTRRLALCGILCNAGEWCEFVGEGRKAENLK
jgi:hypothetical protein